MPRSNASPTDSTPAAAAPVTARSWLAATAALASTAAVVVVAPAASARFAPRSHTAAPAARLAPRSPASSSSDPGHDDSGSAAEISASRNTLLLRQLQLSADPSRRLRLRNALVSANLPLARSVAARLQNPRHASFDDMVQVASLGLIRAVEAFDPGRRVSFSSFAVPYIRGALLHELRDHQAPVRIPRPLWELRQQVARLQEERRQRGQAPMDPASLARRLGCAREQLLELETLGTVAAPRSLDAPAGPGWPGEIGATLLDRLADPRSLPHPGDRDNGDDQDAGAEAAMRSWLKARLNELDPMRRELLEGRLNLDCTWVELGQRLGIHPRMAQRRCDATLAELRREAAAWQAGRQSPSPQDLKVSSAAQPGRS